MAVLRGWSWQTYITEVTNIVLILPQTPKSSPAQECLNDLQDYKNPSNHHMHFVALIQNEL